MKTLNGCVRGVLCFIVFFCFLGLNAQEWRRYSLEEAENQQKFRQRLETDKELKDAYERYMTAIKKQKDKLEADTEYQKLHQQLQEARKLLSKMRSEDRGGDEVTTQNRLIDTLERKLKERIDGNDDFKAGLTEISDSRRKLMALLEKNEISLYDFRLTMEDFLRDGDIELVEDTQSNYELREDNPFKDAFSDLSKALFQRDFCIEAAEEITKAL
ncbi:MAG: hypothetical protein IKX48_04175, partial [Victivallales bacterium]|nr:hypothetical protein [Victivallales bacterium]